MQTPDHSRLKPQLKILSKRKQLAFALLMFERMLPLLLTFSKRTGFDSSVHLRARAAAWNALAQKEIRAKDASWRSLSAECLKSAPNTEKYTNEFVSYALNAALSMAAVLDFIIDGSVNHILKIAELARDSVDMYLESSDPSLVSEPGTERLDAHPLLQREHQHQKQDLEFLSALQEGFRDDVLRKRAGAQPPLLPLEGKIRARSVGRK